MSAHYTARSTKAQLIATLMQLSPDTVADEAELETNAVLKQMIDDAAGYEEATTVDAEYPEWVPSEIVSRTAADEGVEDDLIFVNFEGEDIVKHQEAQKVEAEPEVAPAPKMKRQRKQVTLSRVGRTSANATLHLLERAANMWAGDLNNVSNDDAEFAVEWALENVERKHDGYVANFIDKVSNATKQLWFIRFDFLLSDWSWRCEIDLVNREESNHLQVMNHYTDSWTTFDVTLEMLEQVYDKHLAIQVTIL